MGAAALFEPFTPIVGFLHTQGAMAGIQLSHAALGEEPAQWPDA